MPLERNKSRRATNQKTHHTRKSDGAGGQWIKRHDSNKICSEINARPATVPA